MLKVCRNCTARPAHSLEKCPQCSAELFTHGDQFLWDYEVDAEQEMAEVVAELESERPKDSDKVDVWKAYAKKIVEASGNPTDAPEVDKLTKPELIELFG